VRPAGLNGSADVALSIEPRAEEEAGEPRARGGGSGGSPWQTRARAGRRGGPRTKWTRLVHPSVLTGHVSPVAAGGVRSWGESEAACAAVLVRARLPRAAGSARMAPRIRAPPAAQCTVHRACLSNFGPASGCAAPQHLHTHVCLRAAAGRRRRHRRRACLPPVSLERLRVCRAVAGVSAARGAGRVGGAGRAGGAPA